MVRDRLLVYIIVLAAVLACTADEPPPERVVVHTTEAAPTLTSPPTPIPTATSTHVPTSTPGLPATSTPGPTWTPVPTATPKRTPTPWATPTRWGAPTATPAFAPLSPLNVRCDDELFLDEILAMSEDKEIRILKIYVDTAEEVERSSRIIRCRGEAVISRGRGRYYVEYDYKRDRDGAQFIGYGIEGYVSTPTPIPTPTSIPTPTPIPTPTLTPTPRPTPTPVPPPRLGSRQNPVRFGTTVEVLGEEPDDHWALTVLGTTPDATDEVLDENQFNDPPEEGHQFYIAKARATYLGPDSNEFDGRRRLSVLGGSGVVYTYRDGCGVIPDRLDSYRELFTGGTVEGNICWQIASTDAGSLVMFLEPDSIRSDGERTWFSLAGTAPSSTPTPTATPVPADRVVPVATPTPAQTPTVTPTPGPITTPAELVERVKDNVVKVEAGFSSSGSGFIFDVEGTTAFVGTNHHVIDDADTVHVVVRNDRTYEALVLGWDADRDVAVLAICCSYDFLAMPWEKASPDVGDEVVALGYPRGGTRGQVTATTGEVAG